MRCNMKEELKEWLGIKPADFVVYAAGAAIVWMYFSRNTALDVVLSVVAVALCVLACFIGMRPDPRLSALANAAKRVGYPACLLATLGCIYLNFTSWNAPPKRPSQQLAKHDHNARITVSH
jgi:hypothetical protein